MTVVPIEAVDSQHGHHLVVSVPAEENKDATGPPNTAEKKPRIYYIDRLRTWLTLLVIVHHCFWVVIAGWFPFYRPWQIDIPTLVFGFMVLSGNQAYFMGLFFFMAGLVTGPSLKRKGTWVFLKDRFNRLMIPAILYDFIFFPLLYCFLEASWYGPKRGTTYSFGEVWAQYYGRVGEVVFRGNQMWFTVTLFFLSTIVASLLKLVPSWEKLVSSQKSMQPTQKSIINLLLKISAFLVVINFVLRIPSTDGYIWLPVIANVGFIGQYSVAFTAGILANTYQFLDHLERKHLRVTIPIALQCYFAFQSFQTFLYEFFRTSIGFYGQTFFITLFEQFFAVFWSYSLLVLFKVYQNRKPSSWMNRLIGSAYATYIVHQWVIIPLAVGLAYTDLYPIVVILILAVVSPFLSWGFGILLKAIPGSNMIL